jgi:tetratricopeptide (TPR) repeat protein/predicted aspartyl protease
MLAPPAARADKCRLGVMELPVRMDGGRPIVTLGINGTEVPLLLDTGAFFSMLPLSTATQLHLPLRPVPYGLRVTGHTGAIDVQMTTVKKVHLQGNEIADVEFLVGGNELGHGIRGVMGRNFLAIADTEFDLAHGMLRLVVPTGDCDDVNFAYWAGDSPVSVIPRVSTFGDRSSEIKVRVQVNDHRFTALLDTGATTLLKLRAARRAGIDDAQMQALGRAGGAGEGHAAAWTAPVAKLTIAGETIAHSVLEVDDAEDDFDMILGIDWFLSHRLYVSRAQDKIYATWNGGPIFVHNVRGTEGSQDEARYAATPEPAAASDADALARSGRAAASRGDYKAALSDLDRACGLAPTDATCFAARAKVHLALNQPDAALADIEQALHLDPTDASTRLLRASARYYGSHDRPGALEDLQALDRSLPDESQLRADLGSFYADLDMPAEALRQWDLWMPTHRQDTARGRMFNQRCWMRMRMNIDLDRALDDCRAAVTEDSGDASYHDSLAWVWLRRDQLKKAIEEFDEAIALSPRSPWSLYGRGLAKAGLRDPAGSGADLAVARKLAPHIDEEARRQGLPADTPAKSTEATAATPARRPL